MSYQFSMKALDHQLEYFIIYFAQQEKKNSVL